MDYIVRPIDNWPGTPSSPMPSLFSANWSDTLRLLDREVSFLLGRNVVLQMFVSESDIRLDGSLRGDRQPSKPGVILSFTSKTGPLSFPCDRFTKWRDNVRAIALALEALRTVDRYGVTRTAEQYRGWLALPPAVIESPLAVLSELSGMSAAEVERNPDRAFTLAAKRTHPDGGGSSAAFVRLNNAWEAFVRGKEKRVL